MTIFALFAPWTHSTDLRTILLWSMVLATAMQACEAQQQQQQQKQKRGDMWIIWGII